jgi:hypothetical protein
MKEQVNIGMIDSIIFQLLDNVENDRANVLIQLRDDYKRLKRLDENIKREISNLKDIKDNSSLGLTEYGMLKLMLLESLDK